MKNVQELGNFTMAEWEIIEEIIENHEHMDALTAEGVTVLGELLESHGLIGSPGHYTGNIISEEEVTYLINRRIDQAGGHFSGVYHMLRGITDSGAEYYLMDGYENLQDLTDDHLRCMVEDLLNDAKANITQ